jgi:hypothetical protein
MGVTSRARGTGVAAKDLSGLFRRDLEIALWNKGFRGPE